MEQSIITITQYANDGRIIGIISADPISIELNKTGLWLDGEADIAGDYVLEGEITPRPECPATLSGHSLSDLPIPCSILIDGVAYASEDGTAELAFDQPGTYRVQIEAWPYMPKEFTLEN